MRLGWSMARLLLTNHPRTTQEATIKTLYKVLICGDRNYGDLQRIQDCIRELKSTTKPHELVIIEGEAPGADHLARIAAHMENVHVAGVWALWSTRHAGAGPQRNTIMLSLNPDEVIAFHRDIKNSKGTKNMIKQAKAAGFQTTLIDD